MVSDSAKVLGMSNKEFEYALNAAIAKIQKIDDIGQYYDFING